MVAEPEISRLVDEFFDFIWEPTDCKKHHEERFPFQKDFMAKLNKPKDTISELMHPFN